MLCGGNLDPHFPKKGDCAKKVEYHWSRLYGKMYFCVIESKKNYRPANSKKNVDFDSSKISEYAATDTPTSAESGIENENILLQCNDEIHTARTFETFFSYVGHKLFHVLSIVQMQQRSQISRGVTKVSALQGEFLMMILPTPSLITNAGDQQIICVAIHENACFSERAAVALLI